MPANNDLHSTQTEVSSLSADKNYIQGEIIVKFKPGVQASEIQSLQSDSAYSVLQSTNQSGTQLWQLNGISVEDALAMYGSNPLIEYIQPNYKIFLETTIPNDPSVNQLWGLNNTGQTGGTPDADIDAPEAWDIQTGNSVVVGVIDTGVDYTHPDLINNMWTNQAEFNGSPGVDDDGNGYVDDIHGYDFVNNDGDPFDDYGHGTHVAGTIAAQGNNGIGISGVSWSSEIMALKFLSASGSGTTFDAIEAIEYATMMGAQITNNSWAGGGYSQALYDAIAAAGAAGQLFIAAAGNSSNNNDAKPSYPASYNLDNIISVAATDHKDQLASFSNYGATSVDLGAPGVNIYSTVPGGGYASYSGTSMATPHVTGVASLIWAQNPTLTAQEVKERILATADPIAALQGKTLTGGRLNAYNALTNTEPAPGEIHGSLWNDLDSDAQWDANETALQGWTVYLDQNKNSQLDAGELSTLTNATGNYTFLNLTQGTYTVAQVLKPGWQATYPPNPHTVFVGSGANVTNLNFGNHFSDNVPSPLNLSFETGDFTNWNVTGNASIQTAAFGSTPTNGTYQALITNGTGAVSDAQLETALGLSAGAIDALGNGNATQGSALQLQSITVQAGDILSFDWNFLTKETTPSRFHNDFGFVAISNSSLSELADTYSSFIPFTGNFNEQTGYGTFTYQFTQSGTFNVGVGVVDVRNKLVDSGLLVDNFSITSGSSSTQGLVDSNETVEDVSQAGGLATSHHTIQSRLDRLLTSSGSATGDNDIIYGGQGNNLIFGQDGNDKLYGEDGNDKIWGNNGDDLLWGGLGDDYLKGGEGHDTFVLAIGEGTDTIRDFNIVEDFIGLSGGLTFGQLSMNQNRQNILISYEDETLAILTGVSASALTQQCFTIV